MIQDPPHPLQQLADTRAVHRPAQAKLPPPWHSNYRRLWTESIDGARDKLERLTRIARSVTINGNGKIENTPEALQTGPTDECIKLYLEIDQVWRQIRNSADVLHRLEVEPTLLREASLARRESIRLRNDMIRSSTISNFHRRSFAQFKNDQLGAQTQVYQEFDRAFSRNAEVEFPKNENALLKASEKDLLVQFYRDLADIAWPVVDMHQVETRGLAPKMINKFWKQEKAAYEIKLKPGNVEHFLADAANARTRELVYKEHHPPLLAVGYKYARKWLQLERDLRGNEGLRSSLTANLGVGSTDELLDLFNHINQQTLPSLLAETSRIRAVIGKDAPAVIGNDVQFQPWDSQWMTKRYELEANSKMFVSAAGIRCCEWSLVLPALLDVAGGLFGCRIERDQPSPSSQAPEFLEIWRVYDSLEPSEDGLEFGRLFIDFTTKRRSESSRQQASRFMPVMAPAPLGSAKVPQMLWTISREVSRFSITGVRALAMDLGRLLEALFCMKHDPAYLPLTSRDRCAQPSLSACIMGDLSFDGKLVDRMLAPAARTQDIGKRMRISVMLTRVHEIRAFFAETHGLVAMAHAFDTDPTIEQTMLIAAHSQAVESWGRHVPLLSRLPQEILRDRQVWPGILRRSCVNIVNQMSSAQILARLLPNGVDGGYDRDGVRAFRSYIASESETGLKGLQNTIVQARGGPLRAHAYAQRLARDLDLFEGEQDERARVLRPIVFRLIQRRRRLSPCAHSPQPQTQPHLQSQS